MTTDQRAALEQQIATGISMGSSIASFLGPQGAIFAVIGKTIAAVEPTLVEDVVALFDKAKGGNPTTDEEKALADKLESLLSPETL